MPKAPAAKEKRTIEVNFAPTQRSFRSMVITIAPHPSSTRRVIAVSFPRRADAGRHWAGKLGKNN